MLLFMWRWSATNGFVFLIVCELIMAVPVFECAAELRRRKAGAKMRPSPDEITSLDADLPHWTTS
jgi:hypothetical protein